MPADPTSERVEAGKPQRGGRTGWIQTFTGKQAWPLTPHVDDLDIADIAHSLSMICRYTGHCRTFYSVAQHSVLASYAVPPEDAKWALLHDATEAYLCDVARPVKPFLGDYKAIERRLMDCVCDKFELARNEPASVKLADLRLLATERRDLMADPPIPWLSTENVEPLADTIHPLPPDAARDLFAARFAELFGRKVPAPAPSSPSVPGEGDIERAARMIGTDLCSGGDMLAGSRKYVTLSERFAARILSDAAKLTALTAERNAADEAYANWREEAAMERAERERLTADNQRLAEANGKLQGQVRDLWASTGRDSEELSRLCRVRDVYKRERDLARGERDRLQKVVDRLPSDRDGKPIAYGMYALATGESFGEQPANDKPYKVVSVCCDHVWLSQHADDQDTWFAKQLRVFDTEAAALASPDPGVTPCAAAYEHGREQGQREAQQQRKGGE